MLKIEKLEFEEYGIAKLDEVSLSITVKVEDMDKVRYLDELKLEEEPFNITEKLTNTNYTCYIEKIEKEYVSDAMVLTILVYKPIAKKSKEKSLDGGKNSFYDIPVWVKNLDDLAEYLKLDGFEFNIAKTLWVHMGDRHKGTNKEREVNKCLHYAKRRKKKLLRQKA